MGRRIARALLALPALAYGGCPFGGVGAPPAGHPAVSFAHQKRYVEALEKLDFVAVKADIRGALTASQDFWPADFGNYGPLFVRLAWHCSGSYRGSDGRGGCDGGRIRFDPERSWEDNTNLDKALRLLRPIKAKYGEGLSWGDLIVLTGTTAIEAMDGPVLGFCAGRIDSEDGSESLQLGPTAEQQELFPCEPEQGNCQAPIGTTTIGLIYVNPEGPMKNPDPVKSAAEIRDVFARMGMNDSETVALIGGGHAFGKTHGACAKGAGPSPSEAPNDPYPGLCDNGTFTSGFEFQWTPTPTKWSNTFFWELLGSDWEKEMSPAGHYQWRTVGSNGTSPIGMLTSDVALVRDPAYKKWVEEYANNLQSLNTAFSHAWYKLTSRDMGPATRCFGKEVPEPQPWQHTLPEAPEQLADFDKVRRDVVDLLSGSSDEGPEADVVDGKASHGALFVQLAWLCSSTFRATDWRGGCNGARIRHTPESQWPSNRGMDGALQLLQSVKDKHGEGLSWSDLIVLAGTAALEEAGGRKMRFCGGRVDAKDGAGSEGLAFRFPSNLSATDGGRLKDSIRLLGLTNREFTALVGGGHALGKMHQDRSGHQGQWTTKPGVLDNEYFKVLLGQDWKAVNISRAEAAGAARRPSGAVQEPQAPLLQYQAEGQNVTMLPADLLFRWDPELAAISEEYASDNDLFLDDFAAAWTRLVQADRYKGPAGSVCAEKDQEEAGASPVTSAALRARVLGRLAAPLLAVAAAATRSS